MKWKSYYNNKFSNLWMNKIFNNTIPAIKPVAAIQEKNTYKLQKDPQIM